MVKFNPPVRIFSNSSVYPIKRFDSTNELFKITKKQLYRRSKLKKSQRFQISITRSYPLYFEIYICIENGKMDYLRVGCQQYSWKHWNSLVTKDDIRPARANYSNWHGVSAARKQFKDVKRFYQLMASSRHISVKDINTIRNKVAKIIKHFDL